MEDPATVKIEKVEGNGQEQDLGGSSAGANGNSQDFSDDVKIKTESTGATPQIAGTGETDFSTKDDDTNRTNGGDSTDASRATEDNEDKQYNNDTTTGVKAKSKDDDKRKLFVGGLSWDTKEKDLKEYFSKFGEVEGLTYKTDAVTGRPRGFAFIIFAELSSVEQVLATGEHVINGKKVDPKRAKARPGKIFVGGLTSEISTEEVKEYFAKYGNVVEMEVPIDKSTNQRKNYCFITFDDIAVSQELLKNPKQTICGKEVDIKQAVPMAKPPHAGGWQESQSGGYRGRGRGGGMRGRGGSGWGAGGYGAPAYSSWGHTGYGVGGDGYGGYEYDGYYDAYDAYGGGYDAYGRGYARGGYGGKMRGGRGVPRHTPY